MGKKKKKIKHNSVLGGRLSVADAQLGRRRRPRGDSERPDAQIRCLRVLWLDATLSMRRRRQGGPSPTPLPGLIFLIYFVCLFFDVFRAPNAIKHV
ncbi:hypothetical protein HanIR_Chr03g0102411 [Helianthus annuus]|nr:hypothetical protein HanIR_Chr03g0102411 [Helianthus annuus]